MQNGFVVIDQMTCSTSKYCFIGRQRLLTNLLNDRGIVGLSSLSSRDMSSKKVQ
jgi:hypothetical protein